MFFDLIHLQNCVFIIQLEQNGNVTVSIVNLKYCGDNKQEQEV